MWFCYLQGLSLFPNKYGFDWNDNLAFFENSCLSSNYAKHREQIMKINWEMPKIKHDEGIFDLGEQKHFP